MVTITFEVQTCHDDCPFCHYFEETRQWFCSQLIGSPVNSPYAVIEDMNTEPLKFCPIRSQ